MTFITDTTVIVLSAQTDPAESCHEAREYLNARRDAADVLLGTEHRVFGSRRLARLLGVAARLENEVSCW